MPRVELLPVTFDKERLLMWADENFRRITDAVDKLSSPVVGGGGGLTVPAGNVSSGTFGSNVGGGAFTFNSQVRFTNTSARTLFWEGLELAHPANVPYIDFHKSADPDEAADYRWRMILGWFTSPGDADTFNIRRSDYPWGRAIIGNSALGAYAWDSGYASFGHPDRIDISASTWQFLARNNGWVGMNSWNQDGELSRDGTIKMYLRSDGVGTTDWIRMLSSGIGIYHQGGGGGWFCNNGDNHIRSYSGNTYSGEFRIGLGVWGGGHAVGGHYDWRSNGGCGILQRWDGRVWCRSGTNEFTITVNGSDFFNVNNSGGWCDFRANLPALGGTTMVFAGSQQMGPTSSRAEIKTDIRPAELGANNPLWKFEVKKFKWHPEKLANAKEINDRHPDGVYGLIIEQVHGLLPESTHPSPYDGRPMGFDQQVLNGVVVDAIQHLKSEIDTLKRGK